jgi:hypothetical protein
LLYTLFMTRPIRIEFSGAFYHVTSRGDRRENIYEDDEDRVHFLDILNRVVADFKWVCHAYRGKGVRSLIYDVCSVGVIKNHKSKT